jgi:hypothetical protein
MEETKIIFPIVKGKTTLDWNPRKVKVTIEKDAYVVTGEFENLVEFLNENL